MANELHSYDLKGKKLSFTDRIANLSPEETPFYSSIGSEAIRQTLHQWQTDTLEKAKIYDGTTNQSIVEGSNASMEARKSTTVLSNNTQIFRKALAVSDTANSTDNYGRAKELMYQMDKASTEIKRDIEATMLQSLAKSTAASAAAGGLMAGFINNCAVKSGGVASADWATGKGLSDIGITDPDTGAQTVRNLIKENGADDVLTEKDIFDMTYNLYLAGSDASVIVFHPKFASFFASLQEKANVREKVFTNGDTRFSMYVSEIRDPLGQVYTLIPNRWAREDTIYFYNPKDWTKMVLRPMTRTQLAKTGSAEKWMIETEMTLKHRHPFASGVLLTKKRS